MPGAVKLLGKNIKLYINTGTESTPTWSKLDFQREVSISIEADEIDLTNLDSGGWKEATIGTKSWSVEGTAVLSDESVAFEYLRTKLFDTSPESAIMDIKVEIDTFGYFRGKARPSVEMGGSHDDAGELSITFEGVGPLSFTEAT